MQGHSLLSQVTELLDIAGIKDGAVHHAPTDMHLLRRSSACNFDSAIYRPLLCLILQGAKDVGTSTRAVTVRAGQSLIVSHTLPVVSRITQASQDRPYTALVFPLDLDVVRSLAPALAPSAAHNTSDPFSICCCDTDPDFEDALSRYVRDCQTAPARALLAPITSREIHARLLLSPHAAGLQKLLWHESAASRIHLATHDIQANLAQRIAIADLAQRIGMSTSAFFEQFKAVTGTSPLQYQKDLRLLKARDALKATGAKVSEIAFSVGYESSAQFSREYARKFGTSPRQDRHALAAL